MGGQQKTELSEDFQSLEQDVELRKAGVDKMYSVSKEYSKHLTRKFEAEGTDTGKVLPIDGLGLVFANHGDEFGSDSSFGEALVSFGKAQQQMATATANFTDQLNSGWLTSLEKSLAQMSEYTNQRKKLDSRRLTYDAMLAKVQKSKKEKRELEDDLRVAKNRYEETSEEVQERAIAIQDSEADQMIALTKLLEIESNWIDEQKRILDDLKKNWVDPSAFRSSTSGRKKTAHTFGAEPSPPSKILIKAKTGSGNRHSRSHYSEDEGEDDEPGDEEQQVDEDEYEEREPDLRSRRQPRPAVTAPTEPRLPPSRRSTLTKEKQAPSSTSNARYGGVRIPGMPPAGAASIQSDESFSPTLETTSSRRPDSNLPNRKSSPNLRRPPMGSSHGKPKKWMRAKWAYNATEPDELELEVGDRVRVTNEINGEWFVGRNEATGRSGMFPAAYCVVEQESEQYLTPETQDTFADPDEHYVEEGAGGSGTDDESESAALRPSHTLPVPSYRPSSVSGPVRTGSYPGKPQPPISSNTGSTIGKRAPPPPPSRRSTTSAAKPLSHSAANDGNDQPEAFGSVSELKKRLGMSK